MTTELPHDPVAQPGDPTARGAAFPERRREDAPARSRWRRRWLAGAVALLLAGAGLGIGLGLGFGSSGTPRYEAFTLLPPRHIGSRAIRADFFVRNTGSAGSLPVCTVTIVTGGRVLGKSTATETVRVTPGTAHFFGQTVHMTSGYAAFVKTSDVHVRCH